tara:strand:- start:1038 stop:1373 length:336 start_codon:yes stop_codon:yes gene_type:complete
MASITNIFIDQGATFSETITVKDTSGNALNLTGFTGIAQIRKSPSSSTSVSFTVAFASDRTTGQLTISLTSTQTAALEAGRYNYDVLITASGGDKTRAAEGIANVNASVSR